MPLSRHLGLAGRWALDALLTLVFWTVGLGLSLLLALQLYIASSNQLEVPPFVVRALEDRLAAGGMHASFGRTRFDPSGRVLIEDLRITLPGFDEPLITADAVYARLDLWALLRKRFEPLELRLTGASLRVPAMFSPSGRPDEIVRDLSADLLPRGAELEIASLNFRVGALAVAAHGMIHLPGLQARRGSPLPLSELLAQSYGKVTKQFAEAVSLLGVLDHPILQLELAPSEAHGALVAATLVAAGMHLAAPANLEAAGLRLTSDFPLLNSTEPIEVEARADRVSLPRLATEARGLRARLRAGRPAGQFPTTSDLRSLDLSATALTAQGVDIRIPSVSLVPGPWPRIHAEIRARPLDAPLAAQADLDLGARTAVVRVQGELAPALVDVIGARMHRDLRHFVSPGAPVTFSGDAEVGPGWTRLRRAGGRFSARDLDTCFAPLPRPGVPAGPAPHLKIDAVSGRLEFDGRRLVATELSTRFGENFARGSYEMDLPTLRYRFLLSGRLRPLDIVDWFPNQPWWGNLFRNFAFPVAPPFADMEWQGRWPTDHETRLFLSIDAPGIAIQGVPFDRVYGRLFIRPDFDDALEFSIARGTGAATGTFARWYDQKAAIMRRLDLDVASTLDVSPLPKMWPKEKTPPEVLTLFAFDRPPVVKLSGRFDTPGAAGDTHKVLHLTVRADSAFRFHGFPLDGTDFTAEVHDDDFVLEPFTLGFAGGTVAGRVEVGGSGAARKIALTAQLKDASLSRAIELVQNYSVKGTPSQPVVASEFLKNMGNVRLNLSAVAEGSYADPLSYRGHGTALVQGPELMKVPLLGILTRVLPIFELRFTTARADFLVKGPEIDVPALTITGAHSRIDAHGTYAVLPHQLDFNLTVHPLQESKSLPGQLVSIGLAPFSQLLEVRLTGSLDKPKAVLVGGPTNVLRSLFLGGRPGNSAASAEPSPLAHPLPAAKPPMDESGPLSP
jgi:hypothetical protein